MCRLCLLLTLGFLVAGLPREVHAKRRVLFRVARTETHGTVDRRCRTRSWWTRYSVADPEAKKPIDSDPTEAGLPQREAVSEPITPLLPEREMVLESLGEYFPVRYRVMHQIMIPQALRLFKAAKGRAPRDQVEFMAEVISANRIELPDLPTDHRYVYDLESEQLMVEYPQVYLSR